MESHGEQTYFVKRIVLPSGKTIEVVYFKETPLRHPVTEPVANEASTAPRLPTAEPHQDLHICVACASELVYPLQWEESGEENWSVLLHCPNCDVFREGVFSQQTVEGFDEEIDRGADVLVRDYKRLIHVNMAEEIERFVGALTADAILPEDF
jgi:hypothetical protein